MSLQDEDFPYTSEDPSLVQPGQAKAILRPNTPELAELKSSMRLAVGSALNGWDAYIQRLRLLEQSQEPVPAETVLGDETQGARDQLRYLLLGILFETPDVFQRIMARADRVTTRAYKLFSRALSPFTSSWFFSPIRNRYEYTAARGEKVIDRLIRQGRREEMTSRQMIQQKAIDDLINDFLEYVVLKTEATQIIQEGGLGMAGGVIDDFRDQSAAVDTLLEQKLKTVFRRRVSQPADSPENDRVEGE